MPPLITPLRPFLADYATPPVFSIAFRPDYASTPRFHCAAFASAAIISPFAAAAAIAPRQITPPRCCRRYAISPAPRRFRRVFRRAAAAAFRRCRLRLMRRHAAALRRHAATAPRHRRRYSSAYLLPLAASQPLYAELSPLRQLAAERRFRSDISPLMPDFHAFADSWRCRGACRRMPAAAGALAKVADMPPPGMAAAPMPRRF